MTTLLIDNYDSYTFNLYQLIASVAGEEPVVVRNDEIEWSALAAHRWDRIVVSPGPGRPERERDLGVGRAALAQREIPVLGVCLGHQGLAHVGGANVVRGERIVHGQISTVFHKADGLFATIPQGFRAVRYHSLVVEPALPAELEALAWADDGTLMAIGHRHRRAWGVQFHPESIGTEHGAQLIANFIAMTARRRPPATPRAGGLPRSTIVPGGRAPARSTGAVRIAHRELDGIPDAERAFAALFGDRESAFWLDSSLVDPALSRFSFQGAALGGLGAEVRYAVSDRQVTVSRGTESATTAETLFHYLSRELARLHTGGPDLPFALNGGFVGYLGYECKADCGAAGAHAAELPDAYLMLADRLLVIDHELGRTHLLALSDGTPAEHAAAQAWLHATAARLDDLPALTEPPALEHEQAALRFSLRRGREHYLANIETCKRLLEAGESYEICLTNQLALPAIADPFALYRVLRRVNPSPYSAYLRLREGVILSSSPERFLRVGHDRTVEAKPIKGTARRASEPADDGAARDALARSPKDRAEHLMIVDLLRNDLGLVSEIGSVHVPKLMDVESYETVHQLVSTIRGRLRGDVDIADAIRATFPGGSMTGAPKLRTMEIIDGLEGAARGVYSGALGYLALNGTADLSIVIRTLVATPAGATIGTGGAIVMLSEAEEEYAEMLLKAQPLLDAVSLIGAWAYDPSSMNQPSKRERASEPRVAEEQVNDAAARREAIRRAHARGPGANLEEAVRMIRAGDAMHGVAR